MPPTVGPMSNMKYSCKGWSFIAGGHSSDLDIELARATVQRQTLIQQANPVAQRAQQWQRGHFSIQIFSHLTL